MPTPTLLSLLAGTNHGRIETDRQVVEENMSVDGSDRDEPRLPGQEKASRCFRLDWNVVRLGEVVERPHRQHAETRCRSSHNLGHRSQRPVATGGHHSAEAFGHSPAGLGANLRSRHPPKCGKVTKHSHRDFDLLVLLSAMAGAFVEDDAVARSSVQKGSPKETKERAACSGRPWEERIRSVRVSSVHGSAGQQLYRDVPIAAIRNLLGSVPQGPSRHP